MAFRPINFEEGKVTLQPVATGLTIAKGNALVDNGSGYLTNASSSTAVDVNFVAAQDYVSTANGQLVACIPTRGVRFSVDCDAAPAVTDIGTLADLASVSTINPDASTNDLFYIDSIDLSKGAVGTSTVVTGYFQLANES